MEKHNSRTYCMWKTRENPGGVKHAALPLVYDSSARILSEKNIRLKKKAEEGFFY